MFSFIVQSMIGSQNLWHCLWTQCTLHLWGVLVLPKSVGSQQRVEVLRYKDIIILYPSFGHIFSKENGEAIEGSSKVAYSSRSVFLRKILTTDNLQKCVLFFFIGVICVKGVGSWWIIYFFIALQHMSYGLCCFSCLEFIGLCRIGLSIV